MPLAYLNRSTNHYSQMKKSLFIVAVLLVSLAGMGWAQNATDILFRVGDQYEFRVPTPLVETSLDGSPLPDPTTLNSRKGQGFTIVNVLNNEVIIDIWNYRDPSDNVLYNKDLSGRKRFFKVKATELENRIIKVTARTNPRRPALTAGAVIIPVKMRVNRFDFSKDVTLGTAIGPSWRVSKYSDHFFNILLGFGITSVTVDSASTRGFITKSTDRSALTPSVGFLLDFNGVQAGLFVGSDLISRKDETKWRYHGRPWFSLGLGYTILTKQSAARNTVPEN